MNTEIKREYKDTVFRMLFKDADNALALYNGLSGNNYMDASQLEFNTLENAIYMNVKNDISFIIGDSLNLYEHQSTWNPNMPLRDLIYITSIYQNYVEIKQDKSIYGNSVISLPFPEFVVFYNGIEEHPEYSELKLSDSYIRHSGTTAYKKSESRSIHKDIGKRVDKSEGVEPLHKQMESLQELVQPSLELVVKVININPGKNEELKQKCPVLNEYAIYVGTVRKYVKTMPLEDAVNKAVEECIKNNVLKQFLMQQKAEVIRMSIFEYDEEKELGRIRKAEREEGEKIGQVRGEELGEQKGLMQGAVNMVITLKKMGISKQEAISKVVEGFGYTQEEAEELVDRHWN